MLLDTLVVAGIIVLILYGSAYSQVLEDDLFFFMVSQRIRENWTSNKPYQKLYTNRQISHTIEWFRIDSAATVRQLFVHFLMGGSHLVSDSQRGNENSNVFFSLLQNGTSQVVWASFDNTTKSSHLLQIVKWAVQHGCTKLTGPQIFSPPSNFGPEFIPW